MSIATDASPSRSHVWLWRGLALFLILAAAAFRLFYLASDCPLDLAPDEAHYWDWSRNLDWSYYSKGPLVAYLIRASCWLAGPWSVQLTGNEMLAVRLPAVVCGSLLLVSLYLLTIQTLGREKLACAVVAVSLTTPLISAGSSIMTIDSPYTCCWGWALVLGYHAVFRRSAWTWPVLGLVIGIGILAKYTMVLFVPSVGLFLLASREHRRLLIRPGFWIMTALAGACCLPILIWNTQHDWVSYRHVSGQAGLSTGPSFRWFGPFVYVGIQFALLFGFWFVAWAAALIVYRPTREVDPGRRYLWWMALPMFAVFFVFSFKTKIEPNWPVTAYLSGMILAGAWLAKQWQSPSPWRRWLTAGGMVAACGLGLAANGLVYRGDLVVPQMAKIVGPPTPQLPVPLRKLDPTCRLRGWRHLAGEVDTTREELRANGIEPVLAGTGWALPGELGFYCAGHPTVYSVGLVQGERYSQYDLWHPNPLSDADRFRGKTFLIVGDLHPLVRQAFEQVEPSRIVTYHVREQPMATWRITVCRGFRGFPVTPAGQERPRF